MTHICLITTGGTIASKQLEGAGRVDAAIAGARLLEDSRFEALPGEIKVDEFINIVSCAMTLPLAFSLARRINERLSDDECRGVVVTHGTDTMEESAYLADLLLASDKPVVFTGAQRRADDANPDGPQNLHEAIDLVASTVTQGLGVVVYFDQRFHAARDVTKAHTSRLDALVSLNAGPLGDFDRGAYTLSRRPPARRRYQVELIETRVDLLRMVQGADDRLIRFCAASGAKAIVLEGFGRGNATPSVAQAVREISATGIPILIASRCHQGRVAAIYGNGGGKDLEEAGCLFGGDLAGPKLRLLASVLLGAGMTRQMMAKEVALA
ncbi:asparaginase [Mesorhizobium sp. M1E.F.Ca.ET.045.02.1.1]|uniref:asparaginase n=1 Tax=Mesorhizobium sp. M1E.F.Ca.ET.045.02.1.1 TaxID=2493672 RepID=UPI000F761FCE|nr:asparaginase [Mesorhizobium sp. M1E.F.Ca.ET.045.02.1.1]AZO25032.1 asparaginase [Mesorhizobium sp. M1E.F.Ca.ET.045.02.1.1]TKB17588.1 MAG: asparaginase [Mesorhizobium sp.]